MMPKTRYIAIYVYIYTYIYIYITTLDSRLIIIDRKQ